MIYAVPLQGVSLFVNQNHDIETAAGDRHSLHCHIHTRQRREEMHLVSWAAISVGPWRRWPGTLDFAVLYDHLTIFQESCSI